MLASYFSENPEMVLTDRRKEKNNMPDVAEGSPDPGRGSLRNIFVMRQYATASEVVLNTK
jgi:hypothetical protein